MRSSFDALTVFDPRRSRRFRRRRNWGQLTLRLLTVLALVGTLVGGWVIFRSMTGIDPVPLRVLGAEGRPLGGALVAGDNGAEAATDAGGLARLPFEVPATLTVTADGYVPAVFTVEALPIQGALALQMEPLVLQGRVVDSNGNGVVGAAVTIGEHSVTTGQFGAFEIVEAMPGTVRVEKAAWEPAEAEWDGSRKRFDVTMDAFMVRALRVEEDTAGDDAAFARILDMADASTVNALVFDTKEEEGKVLHTFTDYSEPQSIGALQPTYDAAQRLAEIEEHGLYAITRIVVFQDPYASRFRNEWALHNSEDGGTWVNDRGLGWMDPTDRGSWEYPIQLGIHACRLGFDEIQFDYTRFPTDGDIETAVYDDPAKDTAEGRVEVIAAFLAEARERINAEGCAVSADVFAIVMSVRDDQGIGQKVEELSHVVDAISPMVYPSHYGRGWLNLENPNDHPAEVIGEALRSGMIRLEGGALLRPWIQGFSWSADQVREAIATVDDLHMGWMLWNQLSLYEEEWLPPDPSG
ncbi:MAG: putative glycoside hydrolase [Acidimicrobiia bacterium]|nr:MAG: putative glycoside hydrolase [Acidimicrobiia bacterium]